MTGINKQAEFSHSKLGDASILTVVGEIDISVGTAFDSAVDHALRQTASPLIIDLSAARYFDTTGLSALVRAHVKKVQQQHDTLYLVIPPGSMRRLFAINNLDRKFSICDTLDDAVARASTEGQRPSA